MSEKNGSEKAQLCDDFMWFVLAHSMLIFSRRSLQ